MSEYPARAPPFAEAELFIKSVSIKFAAPPSVKYAYIAPPLPLVDLLPSNTEFCIV